MFTNSFPLLIKPASDSCNLRCAHCFYHRESPDSAVKKAPRMSEDTLKTLIQSYLATPLQRHTFIWQGGEPTLMGMPFFAHALALQNAYKSQESVIENCLQTNGTLLSNDFTKFLAKNNFLVGLSIDGPEQLHNVYRRYPSNKGSYAKVMQNFQRMRTAGVAVNALTLLTAHNCARAVDIFYHLAQKKILYQQYIPCVEFDAQGMPRPWTVDARAWGKALCSLFDAWLAEKGRISLRYFDSLLYTFMTGKSALCHMDSHCGQYAVVEYNGDIFPCDFFVRAHWNLGNIHTSSWPAVWENPLYQAFRQAKSAYAQECSTCEWLSLCAGDCPKHRAPQGQNTPPPRSWLCEGYRLFFAHAVPFLRQLALPSG